MSTDLVSVVIATRERPQLVRKAIRAVLDQDHTGPIEVVVVFDQSPPDQTLLSSEPGREVRVVTNTRTPGLAGARNSGIESARGAYVAFCDDDDWWKPSKLRLQLAAAQASEATTGARPPLVTCAIEVDFEGQRSPRTAGTTSVTHAHLVRSRMSMLHSSTLLFDRQALVDRIGLVNEEVPGSQNEDWDLLLRASAEAPIVHVDEPLVVVVWGTASFFSRTWDTKISSLHWMLEQHPALREDRKALARVYGQIAFGEASRPNRRAAASWALKALARDPLQWRAAVALVVAARLVSPARVLNTLHKFGRGV